MNLDHPNLSSLIVVRFNVPESRMSYIFKELMQICIDIDSYKWDNGTRSVMLTITAGRSDAQMVELKKIIEKNQSYLGDCQKTIEFQNNFIS